MTASQSTSANGKEESDNSSMYASLNADLHGGAVIYTVRGFPDDPNAQVQLILGTNFGDVTLEMSDEQARGLAEELLSAAATE